MVQRDPQIRRGYEPANRQARFGLLNRRLRTAHGSRACDIAALRACRRPRNTRWYSAVRLAPLYPALITVNANLRQDELWSESNLTRRAYCWKTVSPAAWRHRHQDQRQGNLRHRRNPVRPRSRRSRSSHAGFTDSCPLDIDPCLPQRWHESEEDTGQRRRRGAGKQKH